MMTFSTEMPVPVDAEVDVVAGGVGCWTTHGVHTEEPHDTENTTGKRSHTRKEQEAEPPRRSHPHG